MADQQAHAGVKGPTSVRAPAAHGQDAPVHAQAATKVPIDREPVLEAGVQTMDDAVRSGSNAVATVMDRSTGRLEEAAHQWTRHGEGVVERSRRSLRAATDFNGVLIRGMTDMSRVWSELAASRAQRRVDSLDALTLCQSSGDFVSLHGKLLQDDLEEVFETSRRLAEVSARIMDEAAQKISVISAPATI